MKLSTFRDLSAAWLMLVGLAGASISIVLFGIALTNTFMALLLLGCLLSARTYQRAAWAALPVELWIGLLLFVWLALSATWSVGSSDDVSESIRKYREFLLLPLMAVGLFGLKRVDWAARAMYGSLYLSTLISFALWLGWIEIPGASLSLKNRIFFGISTSVFFYWSLLRVADTSGTPRILSLVAAFLALFALLFIETGRTGYVMTVLLLVWFLFTQFRGAITRIAGFVVAMVGLFTAYSFDDGLQSRVNQSVGNTVAYFESGQPSSIGYRLEFYRNSLVGWQAEPLFGHGAGSYATVVQEVGNPDRPWGIGHNPHQQYLLFLLEGGLVAGVLFLAFLAMAGWRAYNAGDRLTQGLVLAMVVSCLFNSSFLDSGDSHFYWLMLLLVYTGRINQFIIEDRK